ncbi:MAG: nuclear transport factor 2 family protein [Phycisphaerae bacterium]|nr:nuclear transport factor 2 family protein [Phycisphaerae bacterium]
MIRARAVLIGTLLVVVVASVLYAAAGTSADYVAVHATIDAYFEGAATAKAGPFEKAWDLDAGRMVFVRTVDGVDSVQSVPVHDAIQHWTSRPAEESWGKVLSIDIIDGRMAVAKVEMLYRGHIYVDMLSLYKINGEWKIVNKTFVRRGEP